MSLGAAAWHASCRQLQHLPRCRPDSYSFGQLAKDRAVRKCCCLQEASSSGSLFPPTNLQYRRVMLKLSGEALQGGMGFGVDPKVLNAVAREVGTAAKQGVQVAVVVGGGNYFRGASAWDGLERATADYVGMLATCMNALMLQSALEKQGVATRVQTAIEMKEIAEPYIRRRAIRHLEKGRVVIFGAGTGAPFFSTDTAAALRAAELDVNVFMKATKVDGVYDCDPVANPDAKMHKRLQYSDVMTQNLRVMDETAITLCKENDIPVVVFNLYTPGNIMRAICGDVDVGTTICSTRSGAAEAVAVHS
ncbi:Uridylate kinase [Coccomyxa sp. Obi]|nr:Uridylate kinase [Coccomyxa sp. Obi]